MAHTTVTSPGDDSACAPLAAACHASPYEVIDREFEQRTAGAPTPLPRAPIYELVIKDILKDREIAYALICRLVDELAPPDPEHWEEHPPARGWRLAQALQDRLENFSEVYGWRDSLFNGQYEQYKSLLRGAQ